ncbi:hypothetical protein SELMODRAFT_403283 [Selaginella moellendorffii]|uniref:Xyloglucan endotransglucosylase/hydrolase n=1 Tax=Selaginella moellendorffii TaxID=88036 RepID=D8QTN6_SELML|nr:probable xyloglucan endotransglucosylase/hydrolase protein 8 [Selaginella moellendorffii]EFJ36681.1 hypothetical protein SELMODRAFT_403283 [Selaginella moellendorffii]|eukprot:XP_002961421.1 probable xyloglucan endotransglucosylase/hydrolase protein 8 [Selaginella moellendorffii]
MTTRSFVSLVAALLCVIHLVTAANPRWNQHFKVIWGKHHVRETNNGQSMQMVLDKSSGSAFQSYERYKFGYLSVRMKLVPNNSAGVVTTLYLSSTSSNHDELDFEFLGNKSGQPYILHTNIFVNGVGSRETRYSLWFDPAKDFHTYAFLWNRHQIVFFVDSIPVRVLRNTPTTIYPSQPMYVYGSIWNGDNWATRGGLDKIDWNSAPFLAEIGSYNLDSCPWSDPFPLCITTTWEKWWDQPGSWTLSPSQRSSYLWVQKNFLIYDYCTDAKRYPVPPKECKLSPW